MDYGRASHQVTYMRGWGGASLVNRNVRLVSPDIKSSEQKVIHEKTGHERILHSVPNNKKILLFITMTFKLSSMKSIRYVLS